MNRVLLIAFKYPPYAGVGGYRWSKISKYLAYFGHKIDVVTLKWNQSDENTLFEDIVHEKIKVHRIPSGYPHNLKLLRFNNNFVNKIKNEMFYYINKFIYYDDEAQYWGKFLLPYCKKLIKRHRIRIIIATGHPFQSNRWATELRDKNNQVKLIQDFRDPWIHPYKIISSAKHEKFIKNWMDTSIVNADHCVFVTEGLAETMLIGKDVPSSIITNGHDICYDLKRRKKRQWIFAGNLSNGRDDMADEFLKVIENEPALLENCKIKFYGHFPSELIRKYDELFRKNIIQYHGIVSQKRVITELSQSKVALHFNSEKFPYLVSTKIYEYAASRIPTLAVTGGGEIDALINDNGWGIAVKAEHNEIKNAIQKITEIPKIRKNTIDQYHYRNIAMEYSKLINQLN